MKLHLVIVLTLMASISWCQAESLPEAREIAEKTTTQWNEAFKRGQVEEIITLYSEDALVLLPGGAVSKGSEQIRRFWSGMIQQGHYRLEIIQVHSEPDGSITMSAQFADIRPPLTQEQTPIRYNYQGVVYSVFKKQADGRWKTRVQRWDNRQKL